MGEHADRGFEYGGTVVILGPQVSAGSNTSMLGAIGSNGLLPTTEAAEAAAIKWVAEQGAETLYAFEAGWGAACCERGEGIESRWRLRLVCS